MFERSKKKIAAKEICLPHLPVSKMKVELESIQDLSISKTRGVIELAGGSLAYDGLSSLSMYGFGRTMTLPDSCYSPGELRGKEKHWTFEDKCPQTTHFLKTGLPVKDIKRVRLQFLAPGGILGPHKDNEDGFFNTMVISVYNPEECYFLFKGQGPLKVESGAVHLIDTSQFHAVVNLSDEYRISLVVLGDFSSAC